MEGIVDGANGEVDPDILRRINMIPELTKAACTILGTWGSSTFDNKLYHFRAMDWASDVEVS